MADELDDACLTDEGESPCRSLEERFEAAQVWGDGGPGVLPGNAIDPSRVGIELIAAQHHATRFGLAIDEVVRVAETRHVARELSPRHCAQRSVLVIDRRRYHERAGHRRHLRGPDATGDDDHLRLD